MTEVCGALAALTLLMVVMLPALAATKARSQRVLCANNLSRIGVAHAMWGADNDNRRPMMVPYWEGGVQIGGNAGSPPPGTPGWQWGALNSQAWFHYYWLSNELVSPKVLLCPSDSLRIPAKNWDSLSGGFLHSNFRNNSLSYVVAHSYSELDRALVSADRNLPSTLLNAGCVYGLQGLREITAGGGIFGWVPYESFGHSLEGNLLFKDGSVEQIDSVGLAAMFSRTNWTQGTVHFLTP